MRNKTLVFALVVVPLLGCVLVACLTASSSFQYEFQGEAFDVRPDGTLISRSHALKKQNISQSGPLPRATTEQTVHDFGVMDPLTMGRHTFTIRNEGDAPLELRQGATSCKCTLSNLSQDSVEPGREATVTLEWNTGRKHRLYSHQATIHTNDPRRESIVLRVEGIVRFYVATHPREPTFGDVRPDKPATTEVVVFSQVWDTFDLRSAKPSLEGLTWDAGPLDEKTRVLLDASSGFRLKLQLPAGMPQGNVSEILHLVVDAAKTSGSEKQDVVDCDVPIAGRVLRSLAVYGPGIDQFGLLELGRIRSAAGLTRRLVVKVRDDDRVLNVSNVTTRPDFIEASLSEFEDESAPAGLYHLDITIPPGTRAGVYNRVNEATIQIEFDHPRIRQLTLRSRFTIVN